MSRQSVLFNVAGEYPVKPDIRLQPTGARMATAANVGWSLRRRDRLTNNGAYALVNHPFPINLGATNSLVSGSKALASGNDVRVWQNGKEVARTLNLFNSASDCYCWVNIPFLAAGGTIDYDVVYGNASAGSPPLLTLGVDEPAFDIADTGASRSTKTFWRYLVDRTVANAGKGGWPLDTGVALPTQWHMQVPGAWQMASTLPTNDDRYQEAYGSYTATGTKYQGRFEARRAGGGALTFKGGSGSDGVRLRVPTGITKVRADMRWINLAQGNTIATAVGKLVILTRNADGGLWVPLYENSAAQATEATIAAADYTPAAAVQEVAFAVWPNDGLEISGAARSDRYINAGWWSVLEVTLADTIAQSTLEAETTIYELASVVRLGGGGETTGVAPYRELRVGNSEAASGAGTPRAACKYSEQIVFLPERMIAEVWNSGLTARVEQVPVAAVSAYDGSLDANNALVERVADGWIELLPVPNPLTNPGAATDATGWTRLTTTAGITAGARARDTGQFNSDTNDGFTDSASFTVNITANSSGTGGIVEEVANDYLAVGERKNMQVSMAIRAGNVNIQPTPTIWWYDGSQVALSGTPKSQATDWTIPAANTWYRRSFAAAVPVGAVYARVGVTLKCKTSNPTGQSWWDSVAVNDSELNLIDPNRGPVTLSAQWQDRYLSA